MMSTWVPTTSDNVLTLDATERPASDVDGGPLGRDPGVPPVNAVVSPLPIVDPALAAIGPLVAAFGKWGTQPGPAPVVLTFSFYDGTVPILPQGGRDPAPLDAVHREALRTALATFADIANVTFVEITESATGLPTSGVWGASGALVGHLRFIDDRALDGGFFTAAYAGMPAGVLTTSGLVAFDVDRTGVDDVSRGGMLYAEFVHEIGHALGLSHPFDGSDPQPAADDARGAYGTWHTGWSMMAYTAPGPILLPSGQRHDVVDPMTADLAVLQRYYGANRATRTGDDLYTLDGRYPRAALWDSGGTNTIDASHADVTLPGEQGPADLLRGPGDPLPAIGGFTKWSGIDLNLTPGAIGPHVAIAFGVAIENAVGSRGHDRITGTDPGTLYAGDGTASTTDGNNRLDGGAGNDTIMGLGGDDTLIGGLGVNVLDGGLGYDIASYAIASTAATVIREGSDIILTASGLADHLRSIESLSFTDRELTVSDALTLLAPPPVTRQPATPPVIIQPVAPPSTGTGTAATISAAVIDPHRRLAITVGGASREVQMDTYAGPVAWLQNMHIGADDGEAMRGTDFADFINLRGGDDAVDGDTGDDVLDGGTGSNFLTGGLGNDTFFVDGRGGGVTWSTVTDLEKGEWVTAWGWTPGVFKMTWAEMSGAEGAKGATAHIDLDANGSIDMSMTIAGKVSGAVIVLPGQVNGSSYLAFTLQ